jgi:hypothetical protein
MSDLVYQNYNNKCQGWVNPSNVFFGPEIISLTGYQSPAGSNTVISIIGSNFYSYSVINFGTFTPTVYFINSSLLSFYVPNTLYPGTYPVKVCNGSVCSNIVNYTIDMSSGYWMINSNINSGTISNTNTNGVQVSWLSRGAPKTITYDNYTILNTDNWIICNNTSSSTTITLPTGTVYTGRELMITNYNTNSILSNSSNIIPLYSSTASSTILSGQGWVTLVYDGSIWVIMQGGT